MKDLKTALKDLAKAKGFNTDGLSDKELFQIVTGIQQPSEAMMSGEFASWYVPGGAAVEEDKKEEGGQEGGEGAETPAVPTAEEVAAHVGEDVTDENKQFDIDNDGDIDEDDVTAANSTVIVDDPTEEPTTTTEIESDSFDHVYDEASWNASYANGGLKIYYEWADAANAPYKEDLWNTVENRAANINDARKDEETGELVLDENGSYIYDNCERCWQGAVNAPGASYPWIVPYFTEDVNAQIIFRYEGKDDVQPWGDKVFGTAEGHKSFGCAAVLNELGLESFDINKFKMILVPQA